jgi:hypothetical protein
VISNASASIMLPSSRALRAAARSPSTHSASSARSALSLAATPQRYLFGPADCAVNGGAQQLVRRGHVHELPGALLQSLELPHNEPATISDRQAARLWNLPVAPQLPRCTAFALGLDRRHRVADRLHPTPSDQVTPGLAEPPKVGAELAGVGEPSPLGGLVEGEGLDHVGHGSAEQPKAHPLRRVKGDSLDRDSVKPDPTGVRCAASTICPARSRISTFSPHGPRLPIGVRRGSDGVDRLAGCSNVEAAGAEGPGPAANTQIEGEPARDQADVRAGGRCAGKDSTTGGN